MWAAVSLLVLLASHTCNAQFGELASLISGAFTGGGLAGLGSGAAAGASGASGALGQIGTFYNLAQTALQLTGTGVGILNQASEGRWFAPAVDNAIKMQREFQERLLSNGISPDQIPLTTHGLLPPKKNATVEVLGGRGNGNSVGGTEEFGKDLTDGLDLGSEEEETAAARAITTKQELVKINEKDTTEPTSSLISSTVTLIPDEITEAPPKTEKFGLVMSRLPQPHRRIRVELPKNITRKNPDYYDDITPRPLRPHLSQSGTENIDVVFHTDLEEEPLVPPRAEPLKTPEVKINAGDKNNVKSVPNLSRLVKLLRHGNADSKDLDDIVGQVEHNNRSGVPVQVAHDGFTTPSTTKSHPRTALRAMARSAHRAALGRRDKYLRTQAPSGLLDSSFETSITHPLQFVTTTIPTRRTSNRLAESERLAESLRDKPDKPMQELRARAHAVNARPVTRALGRARGRTRSSLPTTPIPMTTARRSSFRRFPTRTGPPTRGTTPASVVRIVDLTSSNPPPAFPTSSAFPTLASQSPPQTAPQPVLYPYPGAYAGVWSPGPYALIPPTVAPLSFVQPGR